MEKRGSPGPLTGCHSQLNIEVRGVAAVERPIAGECLAAAAEDHALADAALPTYHGALAADLDGGRAGHAALLMRP
jgi:hypothetical protein